MKITILIALTLAGIHVGQADPLNKEEAQGHPLEQEQDKGNIFLEPIEKDRLKRAACTNVGCIRFCGRERLGVCRNGGCVCG